MVVRRITIAVCDLIRFWGRIPKERKSNQLVSFKVFVLSIDGQLENRVARPMPAIRKNLAGIGSTSRRQATNMPVFADFIVGSCMTNSPLNAFEIDIRGDGYKSHPSPRFGTSNSTALIISRIISVTPVAQI